MNTSEVLDRAADEIERRGWGQGPETWTGGTGLCLEGGIAAAMGLRLNARGSVGADAHVAMLECPAYAAVVAYLSLPSRDECGELWRWNDNVCETEAQVIETLRAAAMVERTREAAVERVTA